MEWPPRLGLIILAVADLGEAANFYRGAFGWPQTVEVPAYVEFELPGGVGLGLYEREAFGRNTLHVPTLVRRDELAGVELYIFVEDLPASVDRLQAVGGRLLSGRGWREWGDEVAYFADPAGNVLAIAHRGTEHSALATEQT